MSERCIHLRIMGRVQGVGYRAWFEQEARRCGLDGWVRNRRDGSVEAVIAGEDVAVETMLAACHSGPSLAKVDTIEVSQADAPVGAGFSIRPTE